jgi:hypothetical protein
VRNGERSGKIAAGDHGMALRRAPRGGLLGRTTRSEKLGVGYGTSPSSACPWNKLAQAKVLHETEALMKIPAPKRPISDPCYNAELQEALDFRVLDLIDQIALAGWHKREAFQALAEVVHSQALAYQALAHEEGPDMQDTPSETDLSASTEFRGLDDLLQGLIRGRTMR